MKEGNVDKHIREKLLEREIQPSASAWERLSSQLDDAEQKKKKHWFLYVGYAASIVLIVSLFFFLNREDDTSAIPENVIVNEDVKKPQIDTTKEFKSVPMKEDAIVENIDSKTKDFETGDVKMNELPSKQINKKPATVFKAPKEDVGVAKTEKKIQPKVNIQEKIKELTQQEETVITQNDTSIKKNDFIKKNGITVDSDALLMSVTSTREELRAYYKKYKIDRADVLATIEKQLKKSKLKVDPKTILAEVESDINEEDFQNNFYQFIKKRVSSVATAIANRNN